ncbi:MAG: flagellar biosynthetic protein FliR [Tepidisphaeraceae bacterium]
MPIESLLSFVPAFVLAFFRMAGMMLAAPILGGGRVPTRVKLIMALVMALAATPMIRLPDGLPLSEWQLAAGIAGELVFGLAIGVMLNLSFIAVNWAGDIIGQQMGLGIGQVLDPQSGQSGAVVGDLYFMFTLVLFLIVGGHRAFFAGVLGSFRTLPPLSLGMDTNLLDVVIGLLSSATTMAMRLAGPILVTMLVIDVVLGFLGRTMPQLNILTAGLSLRTVVGMIVLVLTLATASDAIRESLFTSLDEVRAMLL